MEKTDKTLIDKSEANTEVKEEKLFSVLTGITWVAGIMAGLLFITKNYGYAFFGFLSIVYITGFLIRPIINIIIDSSHRLIPLKEKLMLGFKFLLVILGIQSSYLIFLFPAYDLYWSYWIFIASFVVLICMTKRENDKDEADLEEEEEKSEEKIKWLGKFKKIGYLFLPIIVAVPNFLQMYTPEKAVTLGDLDIPQYITLEKIIQSDTTYNNTSYLNNSRRKINIKDREILKELIERLEGTTIKNTRYIDELNYLKMQRLETHYYRGHFYYEETGIVYKDIYEDDTKDKVKYIYGIEVFPNNQVYLVLPTGKRLDTEKFRIQLEESFLDELI